MPGKLASRIDSCGKTIRQIFGADEVLTTAQKRTLTGGHATLMDIIRDLAGPKPKYGDCVQRALHDCHPRTEYFPALMIRDVAEVCVTLHELERELDTLVERDRALETRMTNAKFFCQYLAQELNALEG